MGRHANRLNFPTWRLENLLGVLAVVVLLFTMIHLMAVAARAWLGQDVLGLLIMLLVIFLLVALAALIYGFWLEKPLRRSARARRGSD